MLYNKKWEPSNPVADLLNRGADLLEKHGHTKGIRINGAGNMCFLGALEMAETGQATNGIRGFDTPVILEASAAMIKTMAIDNAYSRYGMAYLPSAVATWNNAPERTGQEVIDAMRKTASALVEA